VIQGTEINQLNINVATPIEHNEQFYKEWWNWRDPEEKKEPFQLGE
jgi:hypothetical protein